MRLRVLTFCAALAAVPATPAAERLDPALVKKAPDLLAALKEKGVLRFRSAAADGPETDVGEINGTVAERLEMALILGGNVKGHVDVLRDASAVAATVKGADHRTADGRAALFAAKYPLAWGGGTARPDAFLTGVVRVQPDLSLRVFVLLVRPGRRTSIC